MAERTRNDPKRMVFGKVRLKEIQSPEKGRVYYYDTACPGLALCVTQTGAKTFYYYKKVQGRPVRVRLGKFPELAVDQARTVAKGLVVEVAAGKDPQAERRENRRGLTLGDLLEYYLEQHAKPTKRTWQNDEQQFNRYLKRWLGRRLSGIRRTDIQTLHTNIGKKHGIYAANRLRSLLHKMFAVAIDDEIWKGTNPVTGIKRFKEEKRDRFLNAQELKRFFKALDEEPAEKVRDYLWMLLLTGARRMNVMTMAWEDVDFDRAIWRIPDTKTGEPLLVPLTDAAIEVLDRRREAAGESQYVFPGHRKGGHLSDPTKVWKRVLDRADLPDLRLHDLRRTLGSWQALMGSSLQVIGKSLGHKQTATTEIYARLTVDPVRESVNRATNAMLEAANGKGAGGE